MTGFADQFKQMKESGQIKEDAVTTETDSGDTTTEGYGDAEALFGKAVEESTVTNEEAAVEKKAEDSKPPIKIRIGTKEFDNERDALAYANELEAIRLEEEAYKRGVEAAKPKEPEPIKPSKLKAIAEELFENPEAALEKLSSLIKEEAENLVDTREKKKDEAARKATETQELWTNFYKQNNDLVDFGEEVELVLQKEWATLQTMKQSEGMKKLAELTRSYVESKREKFLPRQELPKKTVVSAKTSTKSATATESTATNKNDSFLSQLKRIDKRNAAEKDS